MKAIKHITDDMLEEVHDAKHRVERAIEFQPLYPDIAAREIEIAKQELSHAEKDHAAVKELIEEFRKNKGEPPQYMMELWEEKHMHYMKKFSHVKCMIEMFNK